MHPLSPCISSTIRCHGVTSALSADIIVEIYSLQLFRTTNPLYFTCISTAWQWHRRKNCANPKTTLFEPRLISISKSLHFLIRLFTMGLKQSGKSSRKSISRSPNNEGSYVFFCFVGLFQEKLILFANLWRGWKWTSSCWNIWPRFAIHQISRESGDIIAGGGQTRKFPFF